LVYKWKPQTSIKISAQTAGERLEHLSRKNGGEVTPQIIVDDARPKKSPLHDAFEWNDAAAAEKYREQQAAYLLRSIVVIVERPDDGKDMPVRAFVNVQQPDEERAFLPIKKVMEDPTLRQQLVARALQELGQWQDRYRQYRELADLMSIIDQKKIDFIPASSGAPEATVAPA
jgi:hypothetical protein